MHSLARDVSYGQRGVLTDRDFASQLNRATCLSLLLNIIAVWNIHYMQATLDHLSATGYPVQESEPCASVADYLGPYQSSWLASFRPPSTEKAARPTASPANCRSTVLMGCLALWLSP